MSAKKPSGNLVAGAAGVGAGLLAYASLIEPYRIQHVKITMNCPRLPIEFDGYRVLLLSDFHSRQFGPREKSVLRIIVRAKKHDLIALCGDLIHTPEGMDGMTRFAAQLDASDGVVATFGNSEHKNGVVPHKLAKALTQTGVQMLLNKNFILQRDNAQIAIAGVDDNVSGHDDIHKALENVPLSMFKLLLMHSPDNIGQAATLKVDVVLSGHTHGGQIKFPILGAPYTHSHFGRRISHGLYNYPKLKPLLGCSPGLTQMYVSRGIGISGFALRFLCRPEVTSITLRRKGA